MYKKILILSAIFLIIQRMKKSGDMSMKEKNT